MKNASFFSQTIFGHKVLDWLILIGVFYVAYFIYWYNVGFEQGLAEVRALEAQREELLSQKEALLVENSFLEIKKAMGCSNCSERFYVSEEGGQWIEIEVKNQRIEISFSYEKQKYPMIFIYEKGVPIKMLFGVSEMNLKKAEELEKLNVLLDIILRNL